MQQDKSKLKKKLEEVYPIKNTLLNELKNAENKKFIQPECLTLTYRQIEQIEEQGISQLYLNIPYVHLSHNKIKSLKGIHQFNNLQGLSISHNLLPDWTELLNIENRSIIQFLRVRRNPLCKNPNYHSKLLEAFQNLEKLDDVKIDDKCHQIKYQTQHASQPYIMQLLKVMQIEFEKIEQKIMGMYPHLFDEVAPTSQKMHYMQNRNQQHQSTNNILGDLGRQKTQSCMPSNRQSTLVINQQGQSTNRSNFGGQVLNTSINANITQQLPTSSFPIMKNQITVDEINFDLIDHLIAFLNNDPTLQLKKSASSILLGGFLLRLWRMLANFMLDPFYKNMMNIYDLQIDLFSRIMKKYRERHDHTLEQFLQQQCDNNPKVDKSRLFSDLQYGYACFFHEMFKLSEPPIVEEYNFIKDHLGIVEKQLLERDQSIIKQQTQTQRQKNQQQSMNQFVGEGTLHGGRGGSISVAGYPQQTFASQMSQSVMEEFNKEQKRVNQSQNQFKNQSELSPKNVSYFVQKNEQIQQQQQSQSNVNQVNQNIANQQAEVYMLQNYFPLFLLNQDYIEIIFESVVEKLVGLLHGYELLMFGELEEDDVEVFYKFQNVRKTFSIFNPAEEIFQSIQNIGKQEEINQSRLANQSRTKSEKSINNLKRRQSGAANNQSSLSNRNNVSQNQRSRLSNRNIQGDGNTSSYASQSNIEGRNNNNSHRQGTADSIGSKKGEQVNRSNSAIDQLNSTLNRLNIKRGHANSFTQNRSALNLNQNTTYQQHNQSARSQGNILPDLSPINQLTNVYNTNLLNTSQNNTANNMSREQLYSNALDKQNYQTLPLTDYSPLNGNNNSVSQKYESANVYDQQGINSPSNIQQQIDLTQQSHFTRSINQQSKGHINVNEGIITPDDLQQGQIGTSYFTQNKDSKDSIVPTHSFNQQNYQDSFTKLNQSKSAGNIANSLNQNIISLQGAGRGHIGQFDPNEYSSYKEYIMRQQIPWQQFQNSKKSLQKSQYFVSILKNILQRHVIPQQRKFLVKLKLASDRKYAVLYNILQRRMKLNAIKFWHRQVRKETKNKLFNLMRLQKFFALLRQNTQMNKLQAVKHNQLQTKYKVFFGLVKILRNKRKIKKGLRKIRRLVFKKSILPLFQKLVLYYFTLPRNHSIQEINYNRLHTKSKQLFNQLSIHFKLEDDYKNYKQSQQQTILDSVKSQILQQSKSLDIKDSFKIAQEQINILNQQSRVQPDKGILIPSQVNPQNNNIQKKNNTQDEDNKRTIKPSSTIRPSSTRLSTIPKDKTLNQNNSRNSNILQRSKK